MPYNVLDPTIAEPAPITAAGEPLTDVGWTLEEFRDEIILGLGNRTDVQTGGSRAAFLNTWINRGYRYIAGMLDIKELWGSVQFTLLEDQPFYAVPNTLMWIKRMMIQDETNYFDTGGIELEQIDEEEYRTLPDSDEVQDNGANPPPAKFFRYGRMIVVWPNPVEQLIAPVDFRVRPADMAALDHSPILPEEFHEAIMFAGLWRAQKGLGLRKEAMITQNDLTTVLRPILNTDAEERSGMHMVMQPVTRKSQLYRNL